MRTPEQWVEWLLAEHGTGTPADVVWLSSGDALGVVRRIQDDAHSPPPLPQLEVDDDGAAAMRARADAVPKGWWNARDNSVCVGPAPYSRNEQVVAAPNPARPDAGIIAAFIANARQDIPALLRDREALLRLLHDSEGLDAYQRGWAAGLDAGQRQALHDARERLSRAELSESRRQLVAATLRLFDVMLEELDRA